MSDLKSEPKQKYGLYIPSLKTFMHIEATYEEFRALIKSLNPGKENSKVEEPDFSDFDHIVEEVSGTPYSQESLELY